MPTNNIDFHSAECSACCKKHVDIRTEIIAPSPDRPNAIRKKIIFRCEVQNPLTFSRQSNHL